MEAMLEGASTQPWRSVRACQKCRAPQRRAWRSSARPTGAAVLAALVDRVARRWKAGRQSGGWLVGGGGGCLRGNCGHASGA